MGCPNYDKCKHRNEIEPMRERMLEIAQTELPRRTGKATEELQGFLDRYEEMAKDNDFAGCPDFQKALLFNVGCSYEHTGDLEKSIELHLQLVQLNPKDHEALYTVGTNLCKMKRFSEALPLLEKAVELQPHNADYQQNLDYALRGGPIIIREKIGGPIC